MEKKTFELRIVKSGAKTCPNCHNTIGRGEEYPWYGKEFCSEQCGRNYFRRKNPQAA